VKIITTGQIFFLIMKYNGFGNNKVNLFEFLFHRT
jgi:hypothetical protein